MLPLQDAIQILLPTALDSFLSNCIAVGGNIKVETIPEYLARVISPLRRRSVIVTIINESGLVTTDNFEAFQATCTFTQYWFKNGVTDEDFIPFELDIPSVKSAAIHDTFSDTEDIDFTESEDFNITAITKGWTGRFLDQQRRTVDVSNGLIKHVWLPEEIPYTLTIINGIIERVTQFIIDYGYHYNWYAVNDPRGIAPIGWHVPTKEDWDVLISYIGGWEIAGGKLKELGILNWASPNTGATDEFGFNAKPAGYISVNFQACQTGTAEFWSSTSMDAPNDLLAYNYRLLYDQAYISANSTTKTVGQSLRYIKDDNNLSNVSGNDGTQYDGIQIGNQIWTAQNSMETLYRNGDPIENITDVYQWGNNPNPDVTSGQRTIADINKVGHIIYID